MSSRYAKKLQGKRVLFFGGTVGIGFAVAQAANENGASLIITGSNQERLDEAARKLHTEGATGVETHIIDLVKTDELDQAFPALLKAASHDGAKPIDHIVWTAGDRGAIFSDLAGLNDKTFHAATAVRLTAAVLLSRALLTTEFKYFKKSASSSITFTGGSGATTVITRLVAEALFGLVKGLALEIAPIRANVVQPGLTLTEVMLQKLPEPAQKDAAQGTLTKVLATPEDVAEAYLYVMKNNSVTGQALISDSGKTV